MKTLKTFAFATLAFGALTFAACSNSNKSQDADSDSVAPETESVEPVAAPKDYVAAIFEDPAKASQVATDSTYATTATGLKYMILKEGTGASPKATDEVTVNYTGKLLDGTVFDTTIPRGEPLTFPLNRVIPGWTEGLQLMKEGGKAVFFIPSNLAYGEQGTPGGPIGPNQDLIFEVELLKVN